MPLNPGVADVLATPAAPTFVQNALGTGGAVTYNIVAVNASGQDSIPSPAATTPANTVATNVNVTLSWSAVPGATGGYRIIRNGKLQANVAAGVTTYTDNAAIGSLTYVAATANPAAPVPSTNSPIDGGKNTYVASIQGLASAASATDIFNITGSASKTVRITRIEVSGVATTAKLTDVVLIKRSGGTQSAGTALTPIPYDSTAPAATATVQTYTSNPASVGTAITGGSPTGAIRSNEVFFALNSAASTSLTLDFGNRPSQAIVLRGTGEALSVSLNGVTIAGSGLDVTCEFTEE